MPMQMRRRDSGGPVCAERDASIGSGVSAVAPARTGRSAAARWLTLAAIMALGLVARLHGVAVYGAPPQSDAAVYHQLALNILARNPYSRDGAPPFRPEYQRTPGYPAFVATVYALAGPNPRAVWLVQAFLGTALVPLAWLIARRLGGSVRLAAVCAALAALDPMLVQATGLLLREALTAVLVAAAVWLAVVAWQHRQWPRWALAGATFGVAALVRPEAVVLPVALGAALAYDALRRKGRWAEVGIAALWSIGLTLAAISPWIWYYHDRFGEWRLGPDQAIGPAQRAAVIYSPTDSAAAYGRALRRYGIEPAGADPAAVVYGLIGAMRHDRGMTFIAAAESVGTWAGEFGRRHPGRWMRQAAQDAVNFSLGYSDLAAFVGTAPQRRFEALRYRGLLRAGDYGLLALYLVARLGVGLIVLAGAAIALVSWVIRPSPALTLPTMLAAVILPTALVGSYAVRVRVPLDPLLLVCAVFGWALVIGWVGGVLARAKVRQR